MTIILRIKLFFQAIEGVVNRFLKFIRIVDDFDGNISLTNLMVYAACYAIYTGGGNGLGEITGILAAIANYTAKKVINKNKTKSINEMTETLGSIKASMGEVSSKIEKIETLEAEVKNLKSKQAFEQVAKR